MKAKAETGASAAEYALLASLIAIVILASVAAFANEVTDLFSDSCASVAAARSQAC